jgi:hypothetical protein
MQTPEDYRKRAIFLRKLADGALTNALRDSYLELAANWDALADEAAGKDGEKNQKPLQSPGGN